MHSPLLPSPSPGLIRPTANTSSWPSLDSHFLALHAARPGNTFRTVTEGVTGCPQVLLEVRLLKEYPVSRQLGRDTPAALCQGSDVSKAGLQAPSQSPLQLPAWPSHSSACLPAGVCATALTIPPPHRSISPLPAKTGSTHQPGTGSTPKGPHPLLGPGGKSESESGSEYADH